MFNRLRRSQSLLSVTLGIITLAAVAVLLVSDAAPRLFPARSHDFLAAFSLGMIALAYLVYQLAHRPAALEFAKALMLAAAFLFWAANQFWPTLPQSMLFNDIAVALFVLDVFLVIIGWPRSSPYGSFAGSCGGACVGRCHESCAEERS